MQGSMVRSMAAVLLVSLIAVTGCAQNRQAAESPGKAEARLRIAPLDRTGSGGVLTSLELSANTASLPTALPVYRVVPPRLKASDVKARAKRLGIDGSLVSTGSTYAVRGKNASIAFDRATGSFDYTTASFETQTSPLTNILTDSEYRRRAEAFLNDMGLMHDDAEFHDVNRGNVVGFIENGVQVERPYMVEVRFRHKPLGGVRFDQGVGPKIVVQFGEDGAIIGAMSLWRDVKPDGSRALLNPHQALKEIERGNAQIFDVYGEEAGTVDEVTLSYLNDPAGYDQQFVLPAYVVKGKTASNKRFTAIAWAIPEDQLLIDEELTNTEHTDAPLSTGVKR